MNDIANEFSKGVALLFINDKLIIVIAIRLKYKRWTICHWIFLNWNNVFEVQGDFRKSDVKMQKSEIRCNVLFAKN